MSMRLQVLLPEDELSAIQRLAKDERLTVGEWVRRALRAAREGRPSIGPEAKLKAIRSATSYSFPAPDIDQMLSEIERGYLG